MENSRYKFRAWDTRTNEWLYSFKELGGFSLFGETIVMGEWLRGVPIEDFDKIVVEQFTGLKDRNKTEIYSADVVDYWQTDGKKTGCHIRYQVVEHETGPIFEPVKDKDIHGSKTPYQMAELIRGLPGREGICAVLEVVGNVYEQPELLK